jgi:hypothetical protein
MFFSFALPKAEQPPPGSAAISMPPIATRLVIILQKQLQAVAASAVSLDQKHGNKIGEKKWS